MTSRFVSALALSAFLSVAPSAMAWTFNNGSFTTPASGVPSGSPVSLMTTSTSTLAGGSAAAYWTVYNNAVPSQTTTWMATAPGGFSSLLVFAGGHADGAVQQFEPTHTKTGRLRLSAWVYVLKGTVSATLGNGGLGGSTVETSSSDGWEYLTTCGRSDGLNNEVYFYAVDEAALFYIDDVTVTADSSCPAS